jgi:hypothetical protein
MGTSWSTFETSEVPATFRLIQLSSVAALVRNTGKQPLVNDGNVDFVSAKNNNCLAFVADGVGHDYSTTGPQAFQRKRMTEIWQRFDNSMRERLDPTRKAYEIDAIGAAVMDELQAASSSFANIGKSSTFSGAVVVANAEDQTDSRRWILSIGIADSGIVRVNGNGLVSGLTSFSSSAMRNIEVGGDIRGAELKLHLVQSGDIVLGLTDGTLDAMAVAGSLENSGQVTSLSRDPAGWMDSCLSQIQAVNAQWGRAADAGAVVVALEGLLERIFETALHATSAHPQHLQPDDCASFAFRV